MPTEQEARIARLFGGDGETSGSGGMLFPEVFTRILEALWKDGPSTEKSVHLGVRELFEHKIKRIRSRWGSPEAYTRDMLHILQDGGYVTFDGGELWSLTEKAVPDTRLALLRIPGRAEPRLRITFHDTRNREAREAVAEYWKQAGKLIRDFEGREYLPPVLQKAQDWMREIEGFLLEAIQNPGTPQDAEVNPARKTKHATGTVTGWAREWIRAAGWYTDHESWLAWNKAHPDNQFSSSSICSVRNVTRVMVKKGEVERRTVRHKRDNCHTEFRYIEQ